MQVTYSGTGTTITVTFCSCCGKGRQEPVMLLCRECVQGIATVRCDECGGDDECWYPLSVCGRSCGCHKDWEGALERFIKAYRAGTG